MVNVLITGGKGQLAHCLRDVFSADRNIRCTYTDVEELDITHEQKVLEWFEQDPPDFCVNCAAYTAVDQAESEPERAFKINVKGVENLARACARTGATMIHISTDFVFDGLQRTPYTEMDPPNPQGVYGQTKWEGEQKVSNALKAHYIFRTSWLYSNYGKNFMSTMLRLGAERELTRVVDDQVGTPTYGGDLAGIIAALIFGEYSLPYGLYHYSNRGQASWFGFAREIFEVAGLQGSVEPIRSEEFPTKAKRPAYSVMNTEKFRQVSGLEVPDWKASLAKALSKR